MPYIGKNLVGILKEPRTSDTMTGDGSDTTLTLTDTPGSTNNVLVFLDGIRQTPVTDYTVMGNTLTFTTAPETGVKVVALTGSASSIDPKMGSVTSSKIVDGMVGNAKIAALSSSKLTGALPAISGANLTNVSGTGIDNVTSDPTISENPSGGVGTIQLNQNSGEMFVCTDATAGANVWINVGAGTGDIEPWMFPGTISGYNAGGNSTPGNSNIIDKFSFTTDGNATDVGDVTANKHNATGQSSDTHGYSSGGEGGSTTNVIDKFSFTANGNATDVGDLTLARKFAVGQSYETHGYVSGGNNGSGAQQNIIDKFTFASNANATDHGDLTLARYGGAGQSSLTHGYTSGGYASGSSPTTTNVIDKFTFASNANATDVGDMNHSRYYTAGQSSTTHGFISAGLPSHDLIDKFPFASNANAVDHGDLSLGNQRHGPGGQSSTTHGYTSGGMNGAGNTMFNVIDKFSFTANTNATDVGDLTAARDFSAGTQV